MAAKQEEKEVELQEQTPPQKTNPFGQYLQSLGEQYEAQQAKVAEAKARETDLIDKAHKAREEGRSVLQALWEEQKPVYDENKEKRLRNKAMIQSLGDILSATTAGALAYGKKGAGVVPTLASNSPYKSIEEMNRLQQAYQLNNEKWKALDYKMREAEAENKIQAAEALATKAGDDVESAIKAAESTKADYLKAVKDIEEAVFKEQNANARAVMREEAANNRAVYNAQMRDKAQGGAKDDESKINLTPEEKSALMTLFDGYTIDSESTTETPIIDTWTGKMTGETKTSTTKRSKGFGEYSASDWENFAAKNHGMVNLLRKAKEGEKLSGSLAAEKLLGLDMKYWDGVINIYTHPDNKYSLDTVIAYVKSTINGKE